MEDTKTIIFLISLKLCFKLFQKLQSTWWMYYFTYIITSEGKERKTKNNRFIKLS